MSEETTVVSSHPAAQAPAWYCPGCGTRYFGPGSCSNGHPPIELEKDPSLQDPEAPPAAGTVETSETDGGDDRPPVTVAPSVPPAEQAKQPEPGPTSAVLRARALLKQAADILETL